MTKQRGKRPETITLSIPFIAKKLLGLAVLCAVLLTVVHSAATLCSGAEQSSAPPLMTLDVKNEPLRSVIEKITRKTRWKIKVPEKLLERPVTQTLNKVPFEEGLRSILNNAGVENLLLMYDEDIRLVTLFDTEKPSGQLSDPRSIPLKSQPSLAVATTEPDPVLQRSQIEKTPAVSRAQRRARRRSTEDD